MEILAVNNTNMVRAEVGEVWQTGTGNRWRVEKTDGDCVHVVYIGHMGEWSGWTPAGPDETACRWYMWSLTMSAGSHRVA